MTTKVLDLKGLKCPLPVLKARRTMKELAGGDILQVLATDPGAVQDFQAYCEATGDTLLEWGEADGVFTFRIRKSA
ncbi:MAG: sulfurtransferase TusA family protein [Proteobacteria bacterium]|nr:sulfurtransferase TusA family protein [Pseudomonadota bacterium]